MTDCCWQLPPASALRALFNQLIRSHSRQLDPGLPSAAHLRGTPCWRRRAPLVIGSHPALPSTAHVRKRQCENTARLEQRTFRLQQLGWQKRSGRAGRRRSAQLASYSYGWPQVSSLVVAVSRPLWASSAALRHHKQDMTRLSRTGLACRHMFATTPTRPPRGMSAERQCPHNCAMPYCPAGHPPRQRLHHKVVVHVAIALHHTGQQGVALASGGGLQRGGSAGGERAV